MSQLPTLDISTYQPLAERAILGVVAFAATYLFARYVMQPLVFRVIKVGEFDDRLRKPAQNVLALVDFILAFLAGTFAAGLGGMLTAASTVAAAATLAVGVAAKEIIRNVASGVFIIANDEIDIGDWIEWDDKAGTVTDISFRVTNVRTFSNEVITVPNAELTDNAVTSPVSNDTLRLEYEFGVGYEHDLERVEDIIRDVAKDHQDVLDDPEPTVRTRDLGASAVQVEGRIWIADPTRSKAVRVRSEFVETVKRRFQEDGIAMPSPTRALTGEVAVNETSAQNATPTQPSVSNGGPDNETGSPAESGQPPEASTEQQDANAGTHTDADADAGSGGTNAEESFSSSEKWRNSERDG